MPKTIDSQVVERWKAFRIKHIDKNQAEAAEKLGTTPASLSYLENGKRTISYKILNAAVTKFGLNAEWLSTGKGVDKKTKEKPTLVTDITELRAELDIQLNMIKIMGNQIDNLLKAIDKLEKSK
ncbi:helix-turn-helix domain-containing protein [Pedobacter glucosidilyticus]|uniref:helix-turn-helix domain-containing protein n=1 Tax=Pedobacter glucosidilyticus TaxID=1122941 RepID=UPI00040D6B3B|nr:helix-turn-helix transcriptional regulator [Pedobacter glucosidilyticus]